MIYPTGEFSIGRPPYEPLGDRNYNLEAEREAMTRLLNGMRSRPVFLCQLHYLRQALLVVKLIVLQMTY